MVSPMSRGDPRRAVYGAFRCQNRHMNLSDQAVTLENCDREPIHIPRSIQSHGALVALDRLGHDGAASRFPSICVVSSIGTSPGTRRVQRPDAAARWCALART